MDIKNITGINEVNRVVKTDKTKEVSKTEKPNRSDSIDLSEQAKRTTELNKYIEIVKNSPDIRMDKVEAAKEKLQKGEYDGEEIYTKLTESLNKKFEIEDKILSDLEEE